MESLRFSRAKSRATSTALWLNMFLFVSTILCCRAQSGSIGDGIEHSDAEIPQIIYWKWDEAVLVPGAVEAGLTDLYNRSDFTSVYVSFHWLRKPFSDPELQDAIARCSHWLRAKGKSMILDVDIRNEGTSFLNEFPNEQAWFTEMIELDLDDSGYAAKDLPLTTTLRWGEKKTEPPAGILAAWRLNLATDQGDRFYKAGSLVRIDEMVTLSKSDSGGSRIEVKCNMLGEGRRAVVFVSHRHVCPDFFSPNFERYFDSMFNGLKGLSLGGIGTDEWGYSLTTWWDKEMLARLIPYSPFMAERYETENGTPLKNDLIHLFYRTGGFPDRSIRVVNQYVGLIRERMSENEKWVYQKTKAVFGASSFVAAHPTWMGSQYDLMIEGLYNGFDWWDVARGYAQVDEDIIMPIRLSLGHKAGKPNWYAMWYVWGEKEKVSSFYRETWRNARYGGRTHYLGYRCPNEGLLELGKPGDLESIWSMEKEIRKVNESRVLAPNSRVAVVFSLAAACNWNLSGRANYPIGQQNILLKESFQFANELFNAGWLCDLIPSTAISKGDLRVTNGKFTYGTQTYDAVFVIEPESLEAKAFSVFGSYFARGGYGAILGLAKFNSLGESAEEELRTLSSDAEHCIDRSSYLTFAKEKLKEWKVSPNNFKNGCELQGGSYIFTAEGAAPVGNELNVSQIVNGHKVEFSGTDFLILKFNAQGEFQKAISSSSRFFKLDGVERACEES